jgi:hypothetical protein
MPGAMFAMSTERHLVRLGMGSRTAQSHLHCTQWRCLVASSLSLSLSLVYQSHFASLTCFVFILFNPTNQVLNQLTLDCGPAVSYPAAQPMASVLIARARGTRAKRTFSNPAGAHRRPLRSTSTIHAVVLDTDQSDRPLLFRGRQSRRLQLAEHAACPSSRLSRERAGKLK